IDFAYACVVSIREILPEERLTMENIWVKRPGTGQIKAVEFENLLGKKAQRYIPKNTQLDWADVE
ncbi:MAG: polyhydroxyalkanoate biosynthesis repressor PhaR, partial [Moorea sp. SIO4G2]|nr:polyhydroxyalkanoate biosynthesis repressor PhaR [Moorena sp. SIO4G2]